MFFIINMQEKLQKNRYDSIAWVAYWLLVLQGLFNIGWLLYLPSSSKWVASLPAWGTVLVGVLLFFVAIGGLGFLLLGASIVAEKGKDRKAAATTLASMFLVPLVDFAFSFFWGGELSAADYISRYVLISFLSGLLSYAFSLVFALENKSYFLCLVVVIMAAPVYLLARSFSWFPIGVDSLFWHGLLVFNVVSVVVGVKKAMVEEKKDGAI